VRLQKAARLASLAAYVNMTVAAVFVVAASINGVDIGIRGLPAALTLMLLASLYWVQRRHERTEGDERLANTAGAMMILSVGGLAGGLVCLLGQTFALPFIDPILHRADSALGVDLESVIRGVLRIPGFALFLASAYLSSFPIIFTTILILPWIGRGERAWELCFAFNLCLLAAAIASAIIPAVGSFDYLPIPSAMQKLLPAGAGTYYLRDLYALRTTHRFIIDPTKLQGVAVFPSFHAMLGLMTAAAWRDVRSVRLPMSIWQGVVILSAIAIGGHYLVDLLAGSLCWAFVYFLWRFVLDREWLREGQLPLADTR